MCSCVHVFERERVAVCVVVCMCLCVCRYDMDPSFSDAFEHLLWILSRISRLTQCYSQPFQKRETAFSWENKGQITFYNHRQKVIHLH